MFVSEVSLWGATVVACLVVVAVVALAFADRQMLRRMSVVFGATVAQMAAVLGAVWLVYRTQAWWTYLLWFLLVWFCPSAGACIPCRACGNVCCGP